MIEPAKKKILKNVKISGTGSYTPMRVYTNEYLETIVDTKAHWIFDHLGIKQRRIAAKGETTSDLGAIAALEAIADAKTQAQSLASSLGVSLVRIISFNEAGNYPQPIYYAKAMSAGAAMPANCDRLT